MTSKHKSEDYKLSAVEFEISAVLDKYLRKVYPLLTVKKIPHE
jgi:hypothetical protein